MKLWAVDPGGVHVGFAEFDNDGLASRGDEGDWECTRAWEKDPENAIDDIAAAMLRYHIDVLVVEEFRLYPDKAMAQTGSTMPTCELIGQIKWAHRLDSSRRTRTWTAAEAGRKPRAGTNARQNWDYEHARDQNPVLLALQPAAIQDPTRGVLRKRGIKSTARGTGAGRHAFSAELHGWHWILRG